MHSGVVDEIMRMSLCSVIEVEYMIQFVQNFLNVVTVLGSIGAVGIFTWGSECPAIMRVIQDSLE
jgi:hypothetical protein